MFLNNAYCQCVWFLSVFQLGRYYVNPSTLNLQAVVHLSVDAGHAILPFYRTDFEVQSKADDSPVTAADLAAHRCIAQGLQHTGLQVVSEEGETWTEARSYWLVDPLDGTKSFINGQPDFTVNIALIVEGRPVWGVVHAPVTQQTWWGGPAEGSWVEDQQGTRRIACVEPQQPLRVLASRNHLNDATQAFIAQLGPVDRVSRGSSLKFCAIAQGQADLFPRLGPCCEWDTAAGEAVLMGAGGSLCDLEGRPLRYGKADPLNPYFIASGQADPRDYLPQGQDRQ